MKLARYILLLICAPSIIFGQSLSWQWARQATGKAQEGYATAADDNGNVYVTGWITVGSAAFGDTLGDTVVLFTPSAAAYIAGYSPSGNLRWAKAAQDGGHQAWSEGLDMATDKNGNVLLTGNFVGDSIFFDSVTLIGANNGYYNFFICKYDSLGHALWAHGAVGAMSVTGQSVGTDVQGNVFVSGWLLGDSAVFDSVTLHTPGGGIFIAKYNSSGNILWVKTGNTMLYSGGYSLPLGVSADTTGSAYIAGIFDGDSITFGGITFYNSAFPVYNDNDGFIVKYDSAGNIQWAKLMAGSLRDIAITADRNCNVYVAGGLESDTINLGGITLQNVDTNGMPSLLIIKYDAGGNILWAQNSGPFQQWNNPYSMATDKNNNLYVTGDAQSMSFGDITLYPPLRYKDPMFLLVLDSTGIATTGIILGSGADDQNGVSASPAGDVYIAGDFEMNPFIIGSDTLIQTDTLSEDDGENMFVAKLAYSPCSTAEGNSNLNYHLSSTNLCQGDSALITFSGVSSPGILPAGAVSWVDSLHAFLEPDTTTTFTLTAISLCGVPVSQTVTLNVIPGMVHISSNQTTICSGASTQICASPPANFTSYLWNTGSAGPCIGVDGPGDYYVNATANSGCTFRSNTVDITVLQPSVAIITATPAAICPGDSSLICAPPGLAGYSWYGPWYGTIIGSNCIETGSSGNYILSATDSNGCNVQSNVISITMLPPPTPIITASTNLICPGDSAQICATQAFVSINWSPPAGGATGACIEVKDTNSYYAVVTDTNGCTAKSNTVNVFVGQGPVAIITANMDSICPGGSAQICATSGFSSYAWNPAAGGATGNCIETPAPGAYYLTVTDDNGCTAKSDTLSIAVKPPPTATISTNLDAICPSDSTQICALQNFASYSWNTSQTTNCIEATTGGDYYVTVTDTTGCTAESNHINISMLQAPSVNISRSHDTLQAYNATNVQWYLNNQPINGATQNFYVMQGYGVYTVAVTGADGCTSISSPVIYNGIENISSDGNISIYPNPLQVGSWKLEVGNEYIGAQVEVLDADGRIVSKSQITKTKSQIDTPVAGGVYLLRITTGGEVVVRKLVKL